MAGFYKLGPHAGLYSFFGPTHYHPPHTHHVIHVIPAHTVIPHVPSPAPDPCANLDVSCCPKTPCPTPPPCPKPPPCPTPQACDSCCKPCPTPPPCPKPPPCDSCCKPCAPCDSCCKPCPPCPKPQPCPTPPPCPKPPTCDSEKNVVHVYPTITQHFGGIDGAYIDTSYDFSTHVAKEGDEGHDDMQGVYIADYNTYQSPSVTPGTAGTDPCINYIILKAKVTPVWVQQYFKNLTPYPGTLQQQESAAQADFNQVKNTYNGNIYRVDKYLQGFNVQYYYNTQDGTEIDVRSETLKPSAISFDLS